MHSLSKEVRATRALAFLASTLCTSSLSQNFFSGHEDDARRAPRQAYTNFILGIGCFLGAFALFGWLTVMETRTECALALAARHVSSQPLPRERLRLLFHSAATRAIPARARLESRLPRLVLTRARFLREFSGDSRDPLGPSAQMYALYSPTPKLNAPSSAARSWVL